MKSNYTSLPFFIIIIIFVYLTESSNSKSIIKSIPGFDGDLPFTFEIAQTGYVGVGEKEDVQVFYYFAESQRDPLHDPLLVYLTGGPGNSALYPFLYQIGPLSINFGNSSWTNITFEMNPYSWTKWLLEHRRFLSNPLYISGISYMGIVVPTATLETFKGNERGNQPQLNIKGCLIVSPLTDKFNDFNSRLEFAHRLALISDDIYESTKETCSGNYVYNDPKNTFCSNSLQRVDECTSGLNIRNVLDPVCDPINPEPICCEAAQIYLEYWANYKDVQDALHVREGIIEVWQKNNYSLAYDIGKNDTVFYSYDIFSSVDYHKQLVTRNCQVLILVGDHDMNFPYVGTEKWIASLNLPIESPWKPWLVDNQIAGYRMTYSKNGYSLTYATIKGAGHGVALYKPKEALDIVDVWFNSQNYISDS